ncbi:nucleoporin 62 like [Paramormyrops kingsleyae]|nr:nuclear pore glycoprotein p62 [Paramormyrops kingsleyae]
MSGFNFGQTTGFSFGTPKAAAGAVPSTGFGLANSTPAPAAGAAPSTGFGLTNSTPAPAAGGGFSFGSAMQTPAQAPAATGQTTSFFSLPPQGATQSSFSFGTPAQSSSTGGGFSFGTSTPKPGLGLTTSQPATTGLTLGSLVASSSGSGFTFGGGLSTQATAAPAAAPTSQPPAGGFSLGGASTAQPSGGFSFGVTKVQVTTASSTAAAGAGFSFGAGTSAPTTQPTFSLGGPTPGLTLGSTVPASTAAAAAIQGSGFAFGIKPSATPAPAPTAAPVTQAAAPSLFSAPIASAAPTAPAGFTLGSVTTAGSTATTSVSSGSLGLLLKPTLGAVTTSAATTATAAISGATSFSLGLKPVGTMAPVSTVLTATSTTASVSAPPVMSYTQLESLINKWSLELEDQERHFLQQATQVNAWDRMLIENGEKITTLHTEMEKVKLDQRRLDQELDFILSQQKELEDLLCPLEESVKEQSGTIYMQNADEERERTYKLAENVDAQLKRMAQDLKEIIEHLNTSSGPADTSDPLQQICKILNAHMDSLQWVDQNSVLLQRRVEEVSKLCESRRKEQEKSFHINFE